ncbi:flocculation-associated PEP-CTERM protein PepA [Thermodesulfatator indicus]
MKKFWMLMLVTSFLLVASGSYAQFVYFDLNTLGISGNDDGVTGYHEQWGFYAKSENTVNLGIDGQFSVGDTFTNIGMLKVGSLLDFNGGAISDDEGLNTNYELTTAWTDLSGSVTAVTPILASPYTEYVTFSYDPGTVLTFYIDDTPDFDSFHDWSSGFTNFSSATDGIPILDFTITGGTGSILQEDTNNDGFPDRVITSSATLYGEVTQVYVDNFLFFKDYGDFYDILQQGKIILAFADENADNFYYNLNDYPTYVKTIADHNGSIDYAIPEPATIILVGSALLGIATVIRRKTANN